MGRNKKTSRLQVCINNLLVGYLTKSATGAISFQYQDAWLDLENNMPISLSLPLQKEIFKGESVYNYFENLLPDSPIVRKKIAEQVGSKSSEVFELLGLIGRDCIGALQFLPDGANLAGNTFEVAGKRLNSKEIEVLLNNLTNNPLGIKRERDFRISIAGAQEKTGLLKIGNNWYLPEATAPTSHIFKKSMGQLGNGIDMSESVFNEWLCLNICKKLGLKIANVEVLRFGNTDALAVERFDRQWSKDKRRLYRIPTEDLCQALGISGASKYEADGGPGILQIMKLLNSSNNRENDRRTFMKAQIIFQLIGAIDGHAKNFSIFLGPEGAMLTPIYDVLTAFPALSKRQIEIKELKLAMAIGKSRRYRIKNIFRRHWYETAIDANFSTKFLDEIFDELKQDLEKLQFAKEELPKNFPSQLLESTINGIKRAEKQLF